MSQWVVEVEGLCRTFGDKPVLDQLTLRVPQGVVYGLVGENGIGKTTLIKHLLGRLAPQAGLVNLFGLNPISEPAAVLEKIGYLSETRDMPKWMRVGEFIRYMEPFYPNWDRTFADELRNLFALATSTEISNLSRGQAARLGLLVAVAHRPPLLLLDEPSSGLDAVVRRDILNEVIRTVAEEGRTVLFSSHLLEEVEQISDQVGVLAGGRIAIEGKLEDLLDRTIRCCVTLEREPPNWPWRNLIGLRMVDDCHCEFLCDTTELPAIEDSLLDFGNVVSTQKLATLEDVFVSLANSGTEP